MDAALAALFGAAIGAFSSIGVMWIQQRQQTRRDRLKMAVDLAIHDHDAAFELAKSKGGARIAPISAFVVYHARVLDHVATGDISGETIKRLSTEFREILDAFP